MAKQPKPRPGHESGRPGGSGAPHQPGTAAPKPVRTPVKK